jgi:hypothetical protein
MLLALLLAATAEVDLPLDQLTREQRASLQGSVPVRIDDLNNDQLRGARDGLQQELDSADMGRKAAGLITAGGLSIIGGSLVAGFGALLMFIPYVDTDGFFAMFVGGAAAIVGGNIMLGIGLTKAGTRAAYLERLENLDAHIRTRTSAREAPPPKGLKRSAPVFRFTLFEF